MIYKLAAFLGIIAVDQGVKWWAATHVATSMFSSALPMRTLIPGLIGIVYVENTGAAFGLLEDMQWLFLVVTGLALLAIAFVLVKKMVYTPLGTWSLVVIAGGAAGNMIDRARFGYVVDMFNFEFMRFAIFNVADACITIGTILFCIYILFFHDKAEKKLKAAGHAQNADN